MRESGDYQTRPIIRLDQLGTWRIQEPFGVTSIISVGEFTWWNAEMWRKPAVRVVITVFVLVHVSVPGQAQDVREELPPNPSHFGHPHIDGLAVTILQVNDDGTATVRIEEVLRGTQRKGVVSAVFSGQEKQARLKIGERILLFGGVDETERTLYQQGSLFRFSEKNRERALKILAPPDRTGPLQLGAFLLILAMPFIGKFLLRLSRSDSLSSRKRRWLTHFSKAVPIVALGVYVFYESGICGYCDIRIDLLLVGPALWVCVVVFFSSFKAGSSAPSR